MTVGHRAALAGDVPEVALVTVDVGLVGFLGLSFETIWAGLGVDDRVLAATVDGTPLAAPSATAALAGELEERAVVPGAVAWDAVDELVAAVTSDTVAVSTDGGHSFMASRPTADRLVAVAVAPPATVVVSAASGPGPARASTWLSLDAGQRWLVSPHTLVRPHRLGRWVTDLAATPGALSATEACRPFLAGDGTWRVMSASALAHLRSRLAAWPEGVSSTEGVLRGPERPLTLDDPPTLVDEGPLVSHPCTRSVPRPPPRRLQVSAVPGPAPFDTRGYGLDGPVQLGVEREPPAPTSTSFALADDGVCSAVRDGACDGAVLRRPRVVVADRSHGLAEVIDAPAGCRPRRLVSARGLGVLLCERGAEVAVYAIDRARTWQREATLPAWARDLVELEVADDGTVLLTSECLAPGTCRAVVRAPVEVGAVTAWWTPARGGAVAFRVLPGGEVLAIEAKVGGERIAVAAWRLGRQRPAALAVQTEVEAPFESVRAVGPQLFIDGQAHRWRQ